VLLKIVPQRRKDAKASKCEGVFATEDLREFEKAFSVFSVSSVANDFRQERLTDPYA
jgi:hypothetical protein